MVLSIFKCFFNLRAPSYFNGHFLNVGYIYYLFPISTWLCSALCEITRKPDHDQRMRKRKSLIWSQRGHAVAF